MSKTIQFPSNTKDLPAECMQKRVERLEQEKLYLQGRASAWEEAYMKLLYSKDKQ